MENRYRQWLEHAEKDAELKHELSAMTDAEIEEAFYKELTFGTGGMRGIMGAGTNRLNRYTLAKAMAGYAAFLRETDGASAKNGVVIAFDNRRNSLRFANIAAGVLAAHGIPAYVFEALRPTPLLSYAVRHLKASGGIMVTASHNPPQYNGVKMYDARGCQLVPRYAEAVIRSVNAVKNAFDVPVMDIEVAKEKGWVNIIGRDVDNAYLDAVSFVQIAPASEKTVKIVFTPLHGASREIGLRALTDNGYDVIPVQRQMVADATFATVRSPNPEDPAAFEHAIRIGRENNADILLAADPDGDRLGIVCLHKGEYVHLSGNQTGALFLEYTLATRKKRNMSPRNGIVYNTIVTGALGDAIANAYGCEVVKTLTGFKFIGEQMHKIETTPHEFVMGYEESYGYVLRDIVRDKDAVQAMLLAAEIANHLKKEQKTMIDYLEELYDTYGHFHEDLVNIVLEGKAGEKRVSAIMRHMRAYHPDVFAGKRLAIKEDYSNGVRYDASKRETRLDFPASDVLKFIFEDGDWFVVRPSGTEPKLKLYFSAKGDSADAANAGIDTMKNALTAMIDSIEEDEKEDVNS